MEEEIDFVPFRSPSLCVIAGASASGKTQLMIGILKRLHQMFHPVPDQIFFMYSQNKMQYEDLTEKTLGRPIEFINELDEEIYKKFNPDISSLLIVDDFQQQIATSPLIGKLATALCHHKNVTLFLLLQNYFFGSKSSSLDIRRSTQYTIFTKSLQDKQMIRTFASRCYPMQIKEFIKIYDDAMGQSLYSHLLIDFHPETDDRIRLRSDILSDTPLAYYIKPQKAYTGEL